MDLSKLMRILLVIGNVFVIILAILILSLSLGYWHEYIGGGFSILVALIGLFVACLYSHIAFFGYAALVGLDLLILLANGVILAIRKSSYSDYCFNYEDDKSSPPFGCDDWRNNGHYQRATGVVVCLFISVVLRALNFASACLLAKYVYDDGQYDEDADTRKADNRDMAERGRAY